MKRENLVKRFDAHARRYHQTHDPKLREELQRLSFKILEMDNVAVLKNALARCRHEDMRNGAVDAALTFLERRALYKLPFARFREALTTENSESRWQIMNAALNGITLVLGLF